jgi:hypothetical protein
LKAVRYILTGLIRLYQTLVSPVLHAVLGPSGGCRFHPTCSVYAAQAIERHGAARGAWLALSRLCRCHPWGPAGDDPVPESSRRVAPVPQPGPKPAAAGPAIAR